VLPEPLIAIRQGEADPASKFPLESKSPVAAVTWGARMLMDVKVELISNPIIRSCTIFFGFVFISLRSHLILTVRLHRFYLCICAHSPLRSYVCLFLFCSGNFVGAGLSLLNRHLAAKIGSNSVGHAKLRSEKKRDLWACGRGKDQVGVGGGGMGP